MMRRPTADGAGKPVFTFSGAATHADSPGRGVDDDARAPPPPARLAPPAGAARAGWNWKRFYFQLEPVPNRTELEVSCCFRFGLLLAICT